MRAPQIGDEARPDDAADSGDFAPLPQLPGQRVIAPAGGDGGQRGVGGEEGKDEAVVIFQRRAPVARLEPQVRHVHAFGIQRIEAAGEAGHGGDDGRHGTRQVLQMRQGVGTGGFEPQDVVEQRDLFGGDGRMRGVFR